MRCQVCGVTVTNPDVPFCPNCGATLPRAASPGAGQQLATAFGQGPGQPPAGGPAPETVPGAPPAVPPGAMPGSLPGYPPPAGWPAPPTYPAPYGAPNMGVPSMPPGASMPGYAQPVPPSIPFGGPLPGYGQPAPPSMPAGMPGMPYGTPPMYPFAAPSTVPLGTPYPGYPMGAPPVPPVPPRKRRTGLIVGVSLAAVLVVLGAAGGALYAFVPQVRTLFSGTSANATPTTTPLPAATATPSEAILYQNTFASEAANWANDSHCSLSADGYHIKDGYTCYAPIGSQFNADVTVDVKQISGDTNQPYGISVRLDHDTFTRYDFDIDALGHWVFFRCDGTDKTCVHLVDYSAAPSIHGGLNVTNTLEVKAKGSHFDFFVNGAHVGQTDDATYTSGLIGLGDVYQGECVFTNLTIAQPS